MYQQKLCGKHVTLMNKNCELYRSFWRKSIYFQITNEPLVGKKVTASVHINICENVPMCQWLDITTAVLLGIQHTLKLRINLTI